LFSWFHATISTNAVHYTNQTQRKTSTYPLYFTTQAACFKFSIISLWGFMERYPLSYAKSSVDRADRDWNTGI
jgi:hypothetical protein